MNRHCDLFCALIVVPMQGTETTKFVAEDNGKNSVIQIIRTKNARIDEINKRFDGKRVRKKFFCFFWKALDKQQNLWYNRGTSRGTTKKKEKLKMENMNRLNRMTVTEEQLKLLYEACVREKSNWCGMAQQAEREGKKKLMSLTVERMKAYENLIRVIGEAEILEDIAE